MNNRKIAEIAIISALALVLGYVESLFPLPFPVPGIKLGLSNLAIVFALFRLNAKSAFWICIVKIFLSALLFSGFQTVYFSLAGGLLSLVIMYILKRSTLFTTISISAAGGVFHNIGQLLVSALILKTCTVFYYLPPLVLSGLVTGILIGLVSSLVMKHIKFL